MRRIASLTMPRHRPALAFLASVASLLAGCSSLQGTDAFLGLITPYRIDIVQGNVVTREQAALVKPGMTRAQVRDVLGSPMIADLFHAERWDYVFTIRRPGTEPQRRSVVVRFEGEAVKAIEAGELPSEHEFVASIVKPRQARVPALELPEQERKALPAPVRRSAEPTPEPLGPARAYPPLEPT